MKTSWKERFRNLRIRYLFLFLGVGILLILIPVFSIIFSFGKILDTSRVKKFLADQILIYTDLEIDYKKVESVVFPLPRFRITDLSIHNNGEEIAHLENLELTWNFYALLYGDFELQKITGKNGRFFLKRNQNGKLEFLEKIDSRKIAHDTEEFRKRQEENPSSPGEILQILPVLGKLENIHVRYVDDIFGREDNLFIESLSYKIDPSNRSLQLDWELELNTARWVLNGEVTLENDNWNLDTIRYKFNSEIAGLRLEPYQDFLTLFPHGRFHNTVLNLRFHSEKSEPNLYLLGIEDFSMQGLSDSYGRVYPPLFLRCALLWDRQGSLIRLQDSHISLEGLTDLYLKGEYNSTRILADLQGDRFHLQSALGIAKIFEKKPDPKSNLKSKTENLQELRVQSHIHLKNLNLKRIFVQSVRGKVDTKDGILFWEDMQVDLYRGKLILTGSFHPKGSENNFRTSVKIYGIHSEDLIESFTKEKLITGKMKGEVYLSSRLGKGSDFQKHLFLKSQLTIEKGELLGYANFIKPVAEVGKWINFRNESTGKSTEFHQIQTKLRIQNQTLYLDELFMNGVGIDAKGSGKYFLQENRMDMRFQASLSGMAGKALKIPIIYKGILGKNFAYLDPVWLGSVYAGTLFLAGPAGAVVGGLTGSIASETVEKTAETVKEGLEVVKDFIWSKTKEPSKGK